MALIVEDGTGKPDAESYVSEADADTYHTNHENPTTWSDAVTATKENALRIAARYLDAKYNGRWKGIKIGQVQRLSFPRQDIHDESGFVLPSSTLPRMLVDACSVLAEKHLSETDGLMPDSDAGGRILEEQVGVGRGAVIEKIKYSGGKTALKTFNIVEAMLTDLLIPIGTVQRG